MRIPRCHHRSITEVFHGGYPKNIVEQVPEAGVPVELWNLIEEFRQKYLYWVFTLNDARQYGFDLEKLNEWHIKGPMRSAGRILDANGQCQLRRVYKRGRRPALPVLHRHGFHPKKFEKIGIGRVSPPSRHIPAGSSHGGTVTIHLHASSGLFSRWWSLEGPSRGAKKQMARSR